MRDATPPSSTASPLSRFRRDEIIANGEVATTFRAYDELTGQIVTLIEFHPSQIVDESIERSFSTRFAREARVLSAIDHPNVTRVVAWGNDHGQPFLVIAANPGRTLVDVIRERGALTPNNAVTIARQILAGLSAIHAAGMLHLKVTPQTVFLGDDGVVRLTDVGLTAPSSLDSRSSDSSRLDAERYHAPEIADGLDVSEATDLYAVGAVLYEALTGQPPFPGANPILVRFARMQAAPPVPSRLVGGSISPALDQIVVQALAKHPNDRFQDAPAMIEALDDVAWQLEPSPAALVRAVGVATFANTAPPAEQPTLVHKPQLRQIRDARPMPPMRRRHPKNSGWAVPLVIAGIAISILIGGLIKSLSGEQPAEAVAGVSVIETSLITQTSTVTKSPTARVVNAAKEETPKPSKTPKADPTSKPTKTPKPTRTPKSGDDS